MNTFVTNANGVSFIPGYPGNLHRLRPFAEQAAARGEYPAAILVRNPANPYDANAIEVHVPAIGGMVGHLPRQLAAQLAPRIDAGEVWQAWVQGVLVAPGKEANPGIEIGGRRVR